MQIRISRLLAVLVLLSIIAVMPLSHVQGQDGTKTPTPATGGLVAQDITLSSMRIRNAEIVSPIGSAQFTMRIPTNWQFDGQSSLNLHFDYSKSGPDSNVAVTDLRVFLNNNVIGTVNIPEGTSGSVDARIALDPSIFNSSASKIYRVSIVMDARDQCVSNQVIRTLLRTDMSYLHFEYRETTPVLDLSALPRPLYNATLTGQTETAILVLPEKYTATDLDNAASVIASFGKLTEYQLHLNVRTINELNDVDRKTRNLIYVGQIGQHAGIDQLYKDNLLPTQLGEDQALKVRDQVINESDGLLQLVINPENSQRAILVVTGRTPDAVRKAAVALGAPSSLVNVLRGPLSLISDVRSLEPLPANTQISLQTLGYSDQTISGVGTNTLSIYFPLPAGSPLMESASLDLNFSYSDILRTSQTALTVLLNGIPIQSVALGSISANTDSTADATTPTLNHFRANIPPNTVLPGQINTMTLVLDVQGSWQCYPPSESIAWFTLHNSSQFTLPQQSVAALALQPQIAFFPAPFNSERTLSNLLIVLPNQPTGNELDQAMRLISLISSQTIGGALFAPRLALGEAPKDVDLKDYNVIVFGRPSTNAFLKGINENLPQQYQEGTDTLTQRIESVTYTLPVSLDIGVLQIFKSPWAADKVVLAISGTGPEGAAKAINVLLSQDYDRTELDGDIIYAANNAISTVNTSQGFDTIISAEAAATNSALTTQQPTNINAQTVTPGPTFTATATSADRAATLLATPTLTLRATLANIPTLAPNATAMPALEQPQWLPVLLGLTGVVILGSIIFLLIRLIRSGNKK